MADVLIQDRMGVGHVLLETQRMLGRNPTVFGTPLDQHRLFDLTDALIPGGSGPPAIQGNEEGFSVPLPTHQPIIAAR